MVKVCFHNYAAKDTVENTHFHLATILCSWIPGLPVLMDPFSDESIHWTCCCSPSQVLWSFIVSLYGKRVHGWCIFWYSTLKFGNNLSQLAPAHQTTLELANLTKHHHHQRGNCIQWYGKLEINNTIIWTNFPCPPNNFWSTWLNISILIIIIKIVMQRKIIWHFIPEKSQYSNDNVILD